MAENEKSESRPCPCRETCIAKGPTPQVYGCAELPIVVENEKYSCYISEVARRSGKLMKECDIINRLNEGKFVIGVSDYKLGVRA